MQPLVRSWIFTLLCSLTATSQAALTDALVGLYQFEQNFLDTSASPQPSHATPVNSPGFTVGKVGQGLHLSGIRDYISLNPNVHSELDFGSPATADATDFTVSMWIRQDDNASDPAVFSNKNWNSGANTGINWAVNGGGVFDLNTKADVGLRRDLDTAANSASLGVGVWSLVTMSVQRTGPTRLYINGVNTGTIAATSSGDFNGASPWNVGQDGTGTYGVEFTGAVDELAIWRRAISNAEATALWAGGAGINLGDMIAEPVLKLIVDRDTGEMVVRNNTGVAQPIVGYQITSEAGAFDRIGWTPVAGRLDAAGDGSVDDDDRWIVFSSSSSATDLSEGSLGSGTIAAGAAISLGSAWAGFYEEGGDLAFTYANLTDEEPLTGLVEFVGSGGVPFSFVDLNFDGSIALSDYAVFLSGYSISLAGKSAAQAHRLGDLNADGRHSVRDFLIFQQAFDAALGAGALQAALATVPEPGAGACIAVAMLGVFLLGRSVGRPATL